MLETEIALTGQLSTPVPLKGKLNEKYIYPDEQDPTVPQWVKDIKEEDIEKWNEPRVEESDPTVPEYVKNITAEEIAKWNSSEQRETRIVLSQRYDFDINWSGSWSKMVNEDVKMFEEYINKYYDGSNANSMLPLTIAVPEKSPNSLYPHFELVITDIKLSGTTFTFYGFCHYKGNSIKDISSLFTSGSFDNGYYVVANVGYRGWKDQPNYLKTNNTTEYTPTNDYNPANKKYVDDTVNTAIATAITGALESEY